MTLMIHPKDNFAFFSVLLINFFYTTLSLAQVGSDADSEIENIIVFGRNSELIGNANTATEGTVGGADLLVRPMLRIAELLEVIPGMVAVQHSGSGKANQYFLRGFNLDHGTDFTTYVDGVPWNLRSHGHGQGYLDVNGLLPESIERLDYRKGPYRADVGDFSMAAASFITTIDRLENNYIELETGQYAWSRIAGGLSTEVAGGTFTGIGELKSYDGPWEKHEGLEHLSIWGKWLKAIPLGNFSVTLSGYEGNWHPTEQIPERVIGSTVCKDVYCSLDASAGGNTSRWILSSQLVSTDWNASAYIQRYDWHMQSNPTYDYQINQFDKRITLGGRYDKTLIEKDNIELDIGLEFRHDDIGPVGVEHQNTGVFVSDIANNEITETSLGLYAEAAWFVTDDLRLFTGLRGEHYDFNVDQISIGSSSGDKSDTIASPKAGLAYTLNNNIEFYGSWGKGFHSNDARGVVNNITPLPGLAAGTGYEAGARIEYGDLKITAAKWWLNLDSELIFVGDSNSVEPRGGSERDGYELTFFWQPKLGLGIDATWTDNKAYYTNNSEGRFIEGSMENTGQIGISFSQDNWESSFRIRYLGPYPLLPDNSTRASSNVLASIRGGYNLGQATLYAEIFNLLDTDAKDITYLYGAYVKGFDPSGLTADDIDCSTTNCLMSRAAEPRTLRLGVKWSF
jgi:outer membrane receptor protein involved in Fe transport